MKVVIAYSGGKDSQASLIWAVEKYGAMNIKAVFCDTGWEHPVTYKHIQKTTKELGVELITLKSNKYDGMIDLAIKKKRFPSSQRRFCTAELKSIPMIDYVLDDVKDHFIMIQGIRGDESHSRSLMSKQCRFFKYYFTSYGKTKKGKDKYHTYRKKEVVEFCKKFADDIIRPVFEWTGRKVIDYILNNDQRPNQLYYEGFNRVGCFPCIMCSHSELLQIIKRYPEKISEIDKYEKQIGSTFFAPNKIPDWFKKDIGKKGIKITPIIVVAKYLESKNATFDMFDDGAQSCMSFYSLCE